MREAEFQQALDASAGDAELSADSSLGFKFRPRASSSRARQPSNLEK